MVDRDDLPPEERALREQGLATGNPNLLDKYQQYLRNQRQAPDKETPDERLHT